MKNKTKEELWEQKLKEEIEEIRSFEKDGSSVFENEDRMTSLEEILNDMPYSEDYIGVSSAEYGKRYTFILKNGEVIDNDQFREITEYANNHTPSKEKEGKTNIEFLEEKNIDLEDIACILRIEYEDNQNGDNVYYSVFKMENFDLNKVRENIIKKIENIDLNKESALGISKIVDSNSPKWLQEMKKTIDELIDNYDFAGIVDSRLFFASNFYDVMDKVPEEYHYVATSSNDVDKRYIFITKNGEVFENYIYTERYEYGYAHREDETIQTGVTNEEFLNSKNISPEEIAMVLEVEYEDGCYGEHFSINGYKNPNIDLNKEIQKNKIIEELKNPKEDNKQEKIFNRALSL